jgi:hypothetical protein
MEPRRRARSASPHPRRREASQHDSSDLLPVRSDSRYQPPSAVPPRFDDTSNTPQAKFDDRTPRGSDSRGYPYREVSPRPVYPPSFDDMYQSQEPRYLHRPHLRDDQHPNSEALSHADEHLPPVYPNVNRNSSHIPQDSRGDQYTWSQSPEYQDSNGGGRPPSERMSRLPVQGLNYRLEEREGYYSRGYEVRAPTYGPGGHGQDLRYQYGYDGYSGRVLLEQNQVQVSQPFGSPTISYTDEGSECRRSDRNIPADITTNPVMIDVHRHPQGVKNISALTPIRLFIHHVLLDHHTTRTKISGSFSVIRTLVLRRITAVKWTMSATRLFPSELYLTKADCRGWCSRTETRSTTKIARLCRRRASPLMLIPQKCQR